MKEKLERLREILNDQYTDMRKSLFAETLQILEQLENFSRQLGPPVKPEIVEIEETELFDKEVLIGGDLGYANKTRTKAITISDYGDGYRIRQYVSNGDMDWQRVGNIPMQLPVKSEIAEALKIAEAGWKRCFISYGREVLNESLQESLRQLDDDKEWQKYCKLRKQFPV